MKRELKVVFGLSVLIVEVVEKSFPMKRELKGSTTDGFDRVSRR